MIGEAGDEGATLAVMVRAAAVHWFPTGEIETEFNDKLGDVPSNSSAPISGAEPVPT